MADNWLHLIEILILAAGAFFAVRQLRLQREEIHTNALREHRRHSMEIDSRLADLDKERNRVEEAFPPSEWSGPIPLDQIEAAFQLDEQLEPALVRMLTQMELLALPVCAGAADEDMAFELVGSTMVRYAILFGEYIAQRRVSQRRTDLFIYLTSIVHDRWAEREKSESDLIRKGDVPFFMRQIPQRSLVTTSTVESFGGDSSAQPRPQADS